LETKIEEGIFEDTSDFHKQRTAEIIDCVYENIDLIQEAVSQPTNMKRSNNHAVWIFTESIRRAVKIIKCRMTKDSDSSAWKRKYLGMEVQFIDLKARNVTLEERIAFLEADIKKHQKNDAVINARKITENKVECGLPDAARDSLGEMMITKVDVVQTIDRLGSKIVLLTQEVNSIRDKIDGFAADACLDALEAEKKKVKEKKTSRTNKTRKNRITAKASGNSVCDEAVVCEDSCVDTNDDFGSLRVSSSSRRIDDVTDSGEWYRAVRYRPAKRKSTSINQV